MHSQILSIDSDEKENDMLYFEFTNKRKRFNHLDHIDPSVDVKAKGFLPIDTVHRQGKIHQGNLMYIIDTTINPENEGKDAKILILKRTNDVVTCPNTWSTLGEHTFRDELPIETVRRGMKEECGVEALEYLLQHGRISNLTDHPLYYERNYGASNDGRIDRQITYLWLVEMNFTSAVADKSIEDLFTLDDEAADHEWISLETLMSILNKKNVSSKEGMSFCHETIVSIVKFGLEELLLLRDISIID